MRRVWTLALPLLLLASPVSAAGALQKVSGPQIKARFTGMEFSDEESFAITFNKDGTLAIFAMGNPSAGKWRVDKDMLCMVRDGPDERCYEVWMTENTVQLREPGFTVTEDGVLQKPVSHN
jgi:hypothetical protein